MRLLYCLLAVLLFVVYVVEGGVANVSLTFDPSLDPTKDAVQFEGWIVEHQRKFYAYTSRPGKIKYTFKTDGYLKFDSVPALSGGYSFAGYIGSDYVDLKFTNTTTTHSMLLVNGNYDKKREQVEGTLRFIE